MIVARDITENKRAAQKALELALEKEKVQLLRDFISDTSHDLKTPLTIIRTGLRLLRKKHPEIEERHLSEIERQMLRLNHMLDDLLTMSQEDIILVDACRPSTPPISW